MLYELTENELTVASHLKAGRHFQEAFQLQSFSYCYTDDMTKKSKSLVHFQLGLQYIR